MVRYYIHENNKLSIVESELTDYSKVVWVDLVDATEEEKLSVEQSFNIELFTEQESEEIESSSKFVESEDEIGINLNFLNNKDDLHVYEPVSFILSKKILYTERNHEYKTFVDASKKIMHSKLDNGDDAFLMILDTRIDYLADHIEEITERIGKISVQLTRENTAEQSILLDITRLQEQTMGIRENTIEIQRILSSLIKSKLFPNAEHETIRTMLADISSLLEHTSFNFDRIEFLQNTFSSLVNMDLNRVMKAFTIITVIFVPPTFIAGLYGMNFTYMPELNTKWGYFYALSLMLTSVIISLSIFRYKKWI